MINNHLDPYGYMIPEIFYDAGIYPGGVITACEPMYWFDGQDLSTLTLTGAFVDQWDDKSGNGRHVTGPGLGQPTYSAVTNRLTFVAATQDYLINTFAAPIAQPNTIFILCRLTGALGDTEYILHAPTINVDNSFWYTANTFRMGANGAMTDGATNALDNIHVGQFNSPTSEYWINGVSEVTGNCGLAAQSGLVIGNSRLFNQGVDLEVMEIIGYNCLITDVNRLALLNYLAQKWDLTDIDFDTAEALNAVMGLTNKPSVARQTLLNTFISGCQSDGVWNKLDIFYMLAADTAANGLINLVSPGLHNATNVHATAFVVDRGYTGDGANDYLNTNYNPNTDGVNYALDSASLGIYCRNNVNEPASDIGARDGLNWSHISTRNGGMSYVRVNSNLSGNVAQLDSRGFFISARLNANDNDLYQNTIKIIDDNDVSTGLPNLEIYILAYNVAGVAAGFATKQAAAAFAGGGMTQTNVNNFTTRLETYLDSIGAGVIP